MNVIAFLIAFVLFVGGIVLFGFAFTAADDGWKAAIFVSGIAAIAVSIVIPFHILGHGEQR